MDPRGLTSEPERMRQLGATEYILYLLEQESMAHLVRMIDFEGPVEPAVMERAFRAMVARRPILRARIAQQGDERPFFALDDREPPEFSVIERTGPDDWRWVFDGELNRRIGFNGQPPIRVHLLASERPGGELIVTCAHSFCDGRSLFVFCRDLLSQYEALLRGENGEAGIAPAGNISPPLEALLPGWLSGNRLEELTNGFVSRQAAVASETLVMFPSQPSENKVSRVLPLEVPAEQTATLRQLAHENKTSMQGVVGGALILALDQMVRPPDDHAMVLSHTIDLRPHLREPVQVANLGAYPGNIFSRHKAVSKVPPWELARDVTTQVAASMNRGDQLVMVLFAEQFIEHFVTSERPATPLTLANLGALDLTTPDSTLRPKTIRGGASVHAARFPSMFCQALTARGTLELTLVYVDPHLSEEAAGHFGASVLDHLAAFARTSQ